MKRAVKKVDGFEALMPRGSVSVPAAGLRHLVKEAIQNIGQAVLDGRMEPCGACKAGFVRQLDPAGSMDWCECRHCNGWTVVKVERPA